MTTILRRVVAVTLIIITVLGLSLSALFITLTATGNFNVSATASSAMSPAIYDNSWAISEKVPSADIKNNDIVVIPATSSNSAIIGRVISKVEGTNGTFYYQLKEDTNALPNEWSYKVGSETFRYVFQIPVVGITNNLFVVIFGVISVLILTIIYLFFLHSPKPKKDYGLEEYDENSEWTAVDEIKSLFEVKN